MQFIKVDLIIQYINYNISRGLSILRRQIIEDILKISLSFDNIASDELIWT